MTQGTVIYVAGPVVRARGLHPVRLYDVVRVGTSGLVGEVIRLKEDTATIQVYEETDGLSTGEPVLNTGAPLSVTLGPGLLGQITDGLQRPLDALAELSGAFIERGLEAPVLDTDQRWAFQPRVSEGVEVTSGQVLGTVQETDHITHRVMVPPGLQGPLESIKAGRFTLNDTVAVVAGQPIGMAHRWPVRQPRPLVQRLRPDLPLVTGTRIIDALFPVARGGAAIIPGGFGTGKTIIEHSLARWADVDIVVYVGCGERGNEMTEVLRDLPRLQDPRTGAPLMERTVLIANTSNMPVAARVASIYTGVTIAEYYRDMGWHVLLLADSTSRWGEALREISGRLEEMPGEEGYPAYLASRLAQFYERAGYGHAHAGSPAGSLTIVGAVSPPGGDFSEPVTQNAMRVTSTFWGLDYNLSRRRHFPAINWNTSYSLYHLEGWFEREVAEDWATLIERARALLQDETELQEIVQLVGMDAISEAQKLTLDVARMLREDFLQQSAFDEVDRYSSLQKTAHMLRAILSFEGWARSTLSQGTPLADIQQAPIVGHIARMKHMPLDDIRALLQRSQTL